jgi:hypothetical protein
MEHKVTELERDVELKERECLEWKKRYENLENR